MRRNMTVARGAAAAAALALGMPLLAACGSGEGEAGEELSSNEAGRTVFVEATANDCQLTKKGSPPGDITFTVRNSGGEPVEFAVLSGDGQTTIGSLPNVGGGIVRDLVVQLQTGDFSFSCKPAGLKQPVTGDFVVSDEDPGGGY